MPSEAGAQGLLNGGLTGAYYNNANLSGKPAFSRNDVRVRFAWNGASPGGSSSPGFAGIRTTGFSVRWTGSLLAPASGSFTFSATTSGPGRLFLTAPGSATPMEVINYAGSTLATSTGNVTLVQGSVYAVTFEFQDMAKPAVAMLNWSGPGLALQAIEPAVHLGVNMTSNADWDGTRMFADAMKQCRGWAQPNDFTQPAPVDAQGWPVQDFLVIPVAGPPDLNGNYLIQFQGLAAVTIDFGYGSFTVAGTNYGATLPSGVGYNASTNTTTAVLNIAPSAGINVFLQYLNTQRSPASPVNTGLTNIKMMRPTAVGAASYYPPATLFNGALKTDFSPFTTVRYMGYLNTNGTTIANWSDRPLPGQPIQAQTNGGALEYMVMLANETGKDVWLNVPVSATADYITKLAQLLLYGSDGTLPYTSAQAHPVYPPLQPNLNVYVEYSNEVWNFEFSQASTNYDLAVAEVAAGGSPLNFDGETNTYYWGWRRVAEQDVAISNDFRAVWGNAAMGQIIRPVLEWQVGDGQATAEEQLDFLADYYGNADGLTHVPNPEPPSYYLYGAGGGWYHSVNNQDASTIAGMYASGLVLPTGVPVDAAWSHSFGLLEMGYEGGFEIGGDGPTSLQIQANLNKQAEGDEAAGLDYYFAQGGGLAMIFNVAGASAYGLANPTVYNNRTPKIAAVTSVSGSALPSYTIGNVVAGSASFSTTLADVAAGIYYSTPGPIEYLGPGTWINWTLNVTAPGSYSIGTNLGVVPGQAISVDGVVIGNSGSVVSLSAGLHGVHVRNLGTSGSLALTNLVLTPGK